MSWRAGDRRRDQFSRGVVLLGKMGKGKSVILLGTLLESERVVVVHISFGVCNLP